MVESKQKVVRSLVFVFLVLFPFGQILKFKLVLAGFAIPVNPIDFIAGLFLILFLAQGFQVPKPFKKFTPFLLAALFCFMFSFSLFRQKQLISGGLYFLRLISYFTLAVSVWRLVQSQKKLAPLLFHSLILVAAAAAGFGWLQYFFMADLRALAEYGWDDHLYRLTGSFLDPGYLSIILVFGFVATLLIFFQEKKKSYLGLLIFFLLTLAFTYARAGYLALGAALFFIVLIKKRVKILFLIAMSFLIFICALPRPGGVGVKLERVFSIQARLVNYQETLAIFKTSPIFGIGFNNLCLAKEKFLGQADYSSHACFGLDASLGLVLATTGVIGLMIFLAMLLKVRQNLAKNLYGICFLGCVVSLLIHSLFVNSLFYPWVMGWLGILYSLGTKVQRN
jgi:hypothetical protein